MLVFMRINVIVRLILRNMICLGQCLVSCVNELVYVSEFEYVFVMLILIWFKIIRMMVSVNVSQFGMKVWYICMNWCIGWLVIVDELGMLVIRQIVRNRLMICLVVLNVIQLGLVSSVYVYYLFVFFGVCGGMKCRQLICLVI